jgi:hypothetical protein
VAKRASPTNSTLEQPKLSRGEEDGSHPKSIVIYRELVKKRPRHIEARIYLANAVGDGFDNNGNPKPGQKENIAILECVLKAPADSAANHYWIHAMEPSNHPEQAIQSAALLASLAPASGYMVHMPGHIYYRVGDYASADRWFAASTEAVTKLGLIGIGSSLFYCAIRFGRLQADISSTLQGLIFGYILALVGCSIVFIAVLDSFKKPVPSFHTSARSATDSMFSLVAFIILSIPNMSYARYMNHHGALNNLSALFLTICMAAFSYHFFELKILRFKKRSEVVQSWAA